MGDIVIPLVLNAIFYFIQTFLSRPYVGEEKSLNPKIVPDCRNKWCKPKMYLVLLVQKNVDSHFLSFAFMKRMGTELRRIISYVGKFQYFQQF